MCGEQIYHVLLLFGIYKGLKIICVFVDTTLKIVVVPFHPAISEEGFYKIQKANDIRLSKQARLLALLEGLSNPSKDSVLNAKAQMLIEACPQHYQQLVLNQALMTNRILNGYYALPNPYKDEFDFEKYRAHWDKVATIEIRK